MGEMIATLERAAHLVATRIEMAANDLDITQAEAHVLAQVAKAGPTPIATLHREFGRKRSTLTNVVDRLEQRKLVRRRPNPDDRRSLVVHLTASGERVARRVTEVLDELESEVRGVVSERDVRGVKAVAAALALSVKTQAPGAHPSTN
jgi:DNA-binding MarR family transcriptional regulator